MTLGEKQRLFVKLYAHLVLWVYARGWEFSDGDAYRDRRVFGRVGIKKPGSYGRATSNHKIRLARDFNLFKPDADGKMIYQRTTASHREIGEYWESLHPLCRWGGRYNDGNHYSMLHNGRR